MFAIQRPAAQQAHHAWDSHSGPGHSGRRLIVFRTSNKIKAHGWIIAREHLSSEKGYEMVAKCETKLATWKLKVWKGRAQFGFARKQLLVCTCSLWWKYFEIQYFNVDTYPEPTQSESWGLCSLIKDTPRKFIMSAGLTFKQTAISNLVTLLIGKSFSWLQ